MGKIRCCSFCGGFNFGKADAIYTAVLVDLDHLDSKNLSCSDRVPLALILRQESLRMIGHCLCWTQLPLNRLMESFILSLNEDVYSIPFYSLRGTPSETCIRWWDLSTWALRAWKGLPADGLARFQFLEVHLEVKQSVQPKQRIPCSNPPNTFSIRYGCDVEHLTTL